MYWNEYKDKYEDTYKEDWFLNGCLSGASFVVAIIITLVICALSSCTTTKYVPVVTTQTDTLIISKQQRDSIYLRDSTHVSEQQLGDTVYIKMTRWRTEFRDREVHDTIYQSRVDSVPMPYPVPEYVEKPLTWWQKTRIHCGEVLLVIMGVLGIIGIIKLKMKILLLEQMKLKIY